MTGPSEHVTLIGTGATNAGRPIAAAHHVRGQLHGYAVHGSARRLELGDRADDAIDAEQYAGRRTWRTFPPVIEIRAYPIALVTARVAALLARRLFSGKARARVDMIGKLQLLDVMQGEHERKAVDGAAQAGAA